MPPANATVAICFFGKHGVYRDRPSQQPPEMRADPRLLNASHAAWHRQLILANPHVEFAVFAHSWSPEVEHVFAERWGTLLMDARHEPAHYALSDEAQGGANATKQAATPLAFKCAVPQKYCERTASMMLSMARSLQLKQSAELERGHTFAAVIVARHDVTLLRPLELPPRVLDASPLDLWLPQQCVGDCSSRPSPEASHATSWTACEGPGPTAGRASKRGALRRGDRDRWLCDHRQQECMWRSRRGAKECAGAGA